jgi:hypothetical protein
MGAYRIEVTGFDDVRWEARVGIAERREGARQASLVVKGNEGRWQAWLAQVKDEMSKPINRSEVSR